MGVTLERVQNKFACIIGELCSEPVILSKFAIWVDLRLAEYKAKGAISLDCSGESPDPLWLKGHDKPDSSTVDEPEPYSYGHVSNRPAENSSNSIPLRDIEPVYDNPPACERLSPDVVVVVKEETDRESGDLYPVSFHPANLDNSLKRQAMQLGSKMYDPFLKSSLPKVGRMSTNFGSTSEDESANQSLISIIRDAKDDDTCTVTDVSNINFSSTMGSDSDIQGQIVSSQSVGDNSLSFSPQPSSAGVTSHLSSPPLVLVDGSNPLQQMIPFQSTQGDLSFSSTTSDNHSHSTMPTCNFCGKTFSRKFSLLRHQRAHHGEQRRFQCPICGLRFKEKHHMKSHRLGVHERVRRTIHQDPQSRVVSLLRDDRANIDPQPCSDKYLHDYCLKYATY